MILCRAVVFAVLIMSPLPETIAGNTMWPGVPVIPIMSTGATDAVYLRRAGIATYGVSGLFDDVDDVRATRKG